VVHTRQPTDTSSLQATGSFDRKAPHLQAHGRYLLPSFQKLLVRLKGKSNPGRHKLTDHFKLHDGPYLNKTCTENRDIPSGAFYINIKITPIFLTYVHTHYMHTTRPSREECVRLQCTLVTVTTSHFIHFGTLLSPQFIHYTSHLFLIPLTSIHFSSLAFLIHSLHNSFVVFLPSPSRCLQPHYTHNHIKLIRTDLLFYNR
jgi:hypothetical protein